MLQFVFESAYKRRLHIHIAAYKHSLLNILVYNLINLLSTLSRQEGFLLRISEALVGDSFM